MAGRGCDVAVHERLKPLKLKGNLCKEREIVVNWGDSKLNKLLLPPEVSRRISGTVNI